jgi:Zn-dependent peptidase ImmA (M78 family)
MIAFERGLDIAQRLEFDQRADLRPLLQELGVEVVPWRFDGRIREVIIQGHIGIDDRLSEPWTRWLTAHAIGHHLLHTGASLYLESWQWVNRSKAERQAEQFAAGLLSGPTVRIPATTKGLARRLGIPEIKAEFVLATLAGR